MPPNQIASLSRSAGSPAFPTAMTTRPQLASSPAIAVLTRGEFAIDIAIRRAEALETAPSTSISTSLRAPSPSRATCSARLASTAVNARRKSLRRGSAALPMWGAPRALAGGVGDEAVHYAVECAGVERLADHPSRGEVHVARPAADRLGGNAGGELTRLAAGLAGEGVGIAGIDHQRSGGARFQV